VAGLQEAEADMEAEAMEAVDPLMEEADPLMEEEVKTFDSSMCQPY
jgi:hypothetical protein